MKNFIIISTILCFQLSLANALGFIEPEMDAVFETIPTETEEKVIISPNPAKDKTVIKIMDEDAQVIQVSIYSLLGNQIFSKNYTQLDRSIGLNVQPFKKGKYLIKITFKDGSTEVKALIKQ